MQQTVTGDGLAAGIQFPDLDTVRQRLRDCEDSALTIYKETDLTPSWQRAFLNEQMEDPGYTKITRLIAYLARHNHPC